MLSLVAIKSLIDVLAAVQTVRESVDWLKLPEGSALQKAIDSTARRFASTFPDLKRQLTAAAASPALKATLAGFVTSGRIDSRGLVEVFAAEGLYLPTQQDVSNAQDALAFFVEAFNAEILRNPATGAFAVDARSASRDAALAERVSAVQQTLERTAAVAQRIEAAVRSDPGDELAGLREAAAVVPLSAAIKMYEVFELRLRRTGGWSRELEAQVQLEIGAAAWRAGDPDTAASYFERAYALDPRDVRIRANSALALAARHRWDEALARIDSVIAETPDHPRARTGKAQVLQMAGRHEEALQVLRPITATSGADPDNYRLHVGAAVAAGLLDEAVAVAERGLRARTESICISAVAFAYAARADAAYRAGRFDAAVRTDLTQARDGYRAAISAARSEHSQRILRESQVGYANVLMELGMLENALQAARDARAADPDDPHAAITLASIALAGKRFEEALSVAEQLAVRGTEPAKPIALAAFCGLNPTATTQQLQERLRSLGLTIESAPFPVFELVLQAALREGTIVAEALTERWSAGSPAQKSIVDTWLAFERSDRAAALQHAQRALSLLSATPDPITAFRLGEIAGRAGEHALAISSFEKIPVTEASPDFIVGAYVNALLALETHEREEKILSLAGKFETAGLFSVPVVHAHATVLENRGELGRAQQLWAALAEREPDQGARYEAAVARCAYRRGHSDEAVAALARITDSSSLTAQELLVIAELRKRLTQYELALRDAYSALQKDPTDVVVGFNYLVFYMGLPEDVASKVQPSAVGAGTIVTLSFSRGEDHTVAITTDALPFDASVYAPGSPEAHLLEGKTVGDTLTWTTGPAGEVQATIKEISNSFRFAARALLSNIQHRFPGKSPISSVHVGEKFEEPTRILAEQQALEDQFLELARAHPIPFCLFAKRLGRDLYRVWASLEAIPFKILVSTNTTNDVAIEAEALNRARGVVLDPLSLLDLKALDLLERLSARFPLLVVPQAGIDTLRECRDSLAEDRARGDLMTIGVRHGELAPTIISKAQLDNAVTFLDEILRFCETKCERAARPRPFTSRETDLVEIVTAPFLVSMVVAGSRAADGVSLLSNDAVVRALSREICGASAFSVLTFIEGEVARGSMDLDTYSNHMAYCLRRMRHVTLRADYLTHLVVSSRPPAEYSVAIDALLDPDLPRDSALRVAFIHTRQVAIRAGIWETAADYLQMLFMRTAKRHGRVALGAIKKALESRALVIVPNIERTIRLISLCEKARWDPDSLLS